MKYKLFFTFCCLFLYQTCLQAQTRHFSPAMGEGKWTVTSNRLVCKMEQVIPRYGKALFVQKNRRSAQFILHAWQPIQRSKQGEIVERNPSWKRYRPEHLIKPVTIKSGREALHLNEKMSNKLLSVLDAGKIVQIKYFSDIGNDVSVDLVPENFQQAYLTYTECVGHLLPIRFYDIQDTTVYFQFNSTHLGRQAKKQLRRIKDYVLGDKSIQKVQINGYTDNTGRLGHNIHLSEYRAKAVKQYLVKQGIPKKMIRLRWHAKGEPIADNETAIGRAQNRRATIHLID